MIQEFKETGWIRKSVDQLREIFAVGENLKLYADFKRKTFAHACAEINAKHGLDLKFKEIKEGRKVAAVEFFFKKATVHQVVNQKTGIVRNVYTKPDKALKHGFKHIRGYNR